MINSIAGTKAETFDLVVLGAGAAGLTAALVAARAGLDVLVVEKSAYVGGTTAISGGMIWVPDNHLMKAIGITDSREAARTYLEATVPGGFADGRLERYLNAAPEAIRYLCDQTEVKLQPVARYPDYYPDIPGSTIGGRVLEPVPFDGARLGNAFRWLRPPLPEFTILGGMMVARSDIPHFRRFAHSPASALQVMRLVARHVIERLTNPRGTSLVLGNALAGRLLYSALAAGAKVRRNTTVSELVTEQGRCTGVRLADSAAIVARRGVVVATGGFSHDDELRERLMSLVAQEISATVDCARGDGIRLALKVGATLSDDSVDPAFWVPVSTYTTAAGRRVVYPHTVTDRAKPGVIAIDATGRRFVNECVSYHEFVRAMLRGPDRSALRTHLICDSRFIWHYGLGAITPFTLRLDPYVKAGYLKRADTLVSLASKIGIDPGVVAATVRHYNSDAINGQDSEFCRGSNAYQQHLGDADQQPNPCVATIIRAPFYAVELRPGDLGTAIGLKTDRDGRVLTVKGTTISGLYSAGNDAASIMQGNYPGPGITLGPALTFGLLAANAAVADR